MGPTENPDGDLSGGENAAFLLVSKLPRVSWLRLQDSAEQRQAGHFRSGCILIPGLSLFQLLDSMDRVLSRKEKIDLVISYCFKDKISHQEDYGKEEGDSCSDD